MLIDDDGRKMSAGTLFCCVTSCLSTNTGSDLISGLALGIKPVYLCSGFGLRGVGRSHRPPQLHDDGGRL